MKNEQKDPKILLNIIIESLLKCGFIEGIKMSRISSDKTDKLVNSIISNKNEYFNNIYNRITNTIGGQK